MILNRKDFITAQTTISTQKNYVLEAGDNWINYPSKCAAILDIWDRDNKTLLEYAKNSIDIIALCGKNNPHALGKPVCYYVTNYPKERSLVKSIHFYPYPQSCTIFTVHYIVEK